MHRLVLAVIFVAVCVALVAFLFRIAAKTAERYGDASAVTTGGAMQKVAFFLLLCLIMYVSIQGAS